MIITKHECYKILFSLQEEGVDIQDDLRQLLTSNDIPVTVIKKLKTLNNPIITFYMYLNNKAHKIIKELLNCDGKSVAVYIKIATSIITQAIITIEHQFVESTKEEQNTFINNLGINCLSEGLCEYFKYGNAQPLIEAVQGCKVDLLIILNT